MTNTPESEKSYLIGLDISTSCTGISIIDSKTEELVLLDYIKVPADLSLFEKADYVIDEVCGYLLRNGIKKPEKVFVEENAKMFAGGLSSADVLMTLAKFNALISYLCYKQLTPNVSSVNVTKARGAIGFKNTKADKRPVKDKVFEFIQTLHPEFPWKTYIPKAGKMKGKEIPVPEMKDAADAWVVVVGGKRLGL